MSDVGTARIEGLRDFNRAIKQVSPDVASSLKDELRGEVAEPVAARARSNVPERTGRWKRAIKAGATQRGAHITWGRKTVPYAGWMEFGGQLPSKRSGKPARVRRQRVGDGRYIYPEVAAGRDEAVATAQRVLDRSFRRARLDYRGAL